MSHFCTSERFELLALVGDIVIWATNANTSFGRGVFLVLRGVILGVAERRDLRGSLRPGDGLESVADLGAGRLRQGLDVRTVANVAELIVTHVEPSLQLLVIRFLLGRLLHLGSWSNDNLGFGSSNFGLGCLFDSLRVVDSLPFVNRGGSKTARNEGRGTRVDLGSRTFSETIPMAMAVAAIVTMDARLSGLWRR